MNKTDLSSFDNSNYSPGGRLRRGLWYFVDLLFFRNRFLPFVGPKRILLKAFGASIGKAVIIKPDVRIKYPWFLTVGDYAWIGEEVWIDNLAEVYIGNHACISQGAMLLCGNHNYKKPSFDLITGPIRIEEGAWIGAQSVVCPGVTASSHSVLAVGSIATQDMEPYFIYRGNPAVKLRARNINPR